MNLDIIKCMQLCSQFKHCIHPSKLCYHIYEGAKLYNRNKLFYSIQMHNKQWIPLVYH